MAMHMSSVSIASTNSLPLFYWPIQSLHRYMAKFLKAIVFSKPATLPNPFRGNRSFIIVGDHKLEKMCWQMTTLARNEQE
jgi:hypothetical protein